MKSTTSMRPGEEAGMGDALFRARANARPTAGAHLVAGAIALLSAGAGVIHLAVVPEHLEEWFAAGVFFIALGAFQIAWAPVVAFRPERWILLAGAVVNAGVVALWAVSRTTGLPVGPEAGEPEAIGLADGLATTLEALIVMGSMALMMARRRAERRTEEAPARGHAAFQGMPAPG
jgi:hypothetical protein